MQALAFDRPGRPEDVLALREMATPVPARGHVLIRVTARPIQPADFLFIDGRYRRQPVLPQIAGVEGVGTVVRVDADAASIRPGMRVAFRSVGAWAEFAVAPLTRVYPAPPHATDATASQFALNPLTAWALLASCALPESSRILITAGRSVVAGLAAELARRQGHSTTLLARDGEGYAVLMAGAPEPTSWQPTVADAMTRISARNGRFHAVLDAVGGPHTLALLDALEPGGRLVTYGLLDEGDVVVQASRLIARNAIWQGFGLDHWLDAAHPTELGRAQRALWNMLEERPDLLPVATSFSLAQVHDAIHAARTAPGVGKVLLVG